MINIFEKNFVEPKFFLTFAVVKEQLNLKSYGNKIYQ